MMPSNFAATWGYLSASKEARDNNISVFREMTRTSIENENKELHNFAKLVSRLNAFFPQQYLDLLNWFTLEFEIFNFKAITKGIHYKLTADEVNDLLYKPPLVKNSMHLYNDKLMIKNIIDELNNNCFQNEIKKYLIQLNNDSNYFRFECCCNLLPIKILKKIIDNYPAKERLQFQEYLNLQKNSWGDMAFNLVKQNHSDALWLNKEIAFLNKLDKVKLKYQVNDSLNFLESPYLYFKIILNRREQILKSTSCISHGKALCSNL